VPKTDADGNDLAGLRVPDISVPTATYTGWALRADGLDGCDANGQRVAFAKTRAERLANHDPRRSLEERYVDHQGYVNAVKSAAANAVSQGFLLQADADTLITAAQASNVLNP